MADDLKVGDIVRLRLPGDSDRRPSMHPWLGRRAVVLELRFGNDDHTWLRLLSGGRPDEIDVRDFAWKTVNLERDVDLTDADDVRDWLDA